MVEVQKSKLVEILADYQANQHESDGVFARRLGVSTELWRVTRSGLRNIGITLLKGVLKTYPELEGEVVFFLRGEVGIPTESSEITTSTPERPQDGQGRLRRGLKRLFHPRRGPSS